MSEEATIEEPKVETDPLRWKKRATQIYEARVASRETQSREAKQKQIDQFSEALSNLLAIEIEVDSLREEIGDVMFVGTPLAGGLVEVAIESPCPDCKDLQMYRVRTLADVGAILSGHPDPHPDCLAKGRTASGGIDNSPEARLLNALRDFIAANNTPTRPA